MKPDFERIRRETLRWLIILTLNNARPDGCRENLILSVAEAEYPDATELEVRRELDYLDERSLVEVTRHPQGYWSAKLLRYGVDVAEYTVDCDPGIARPPRL